MIKVLKVLALCSVLVAPMSGAQQPAEVAEPLKYYDVEIVIFRNVNVPRGDEVNLPTPLAKRPPKSLDLFDPTSIDKATELGFTPLLSDELRMQDLVGSIIRSSRYALLLHTGWRQPGLEEEQALPVWIRGGELFDEGYQSIDQVIRPQPVDPLTQSALETEAASPDSADPTQPLNNIALDSAAMSEDSNSNTSTETALPVYERVRGLYELEGQIKIILSRYLHTDANLVLRKPSGNQAISSGVTGTVLRNYALKEKRRMRSKRLHYLDHPEFGMLVMITPYDMPAEAPVDTAQRTPEATPAGSSPVAQPGTQGAPGGGI